MIVEDGVDLDLYEAVEGAKRRLSDHEHTEVTLDYPGAEFTHPVARSKFPPRCRATHGAHFRGDGAHLERGRGDAGQRWTSCASREARRGCP